MYPQIEPYDHGMLDVGDGHSVYWMACGNPTASLRCTCTAAPARGAARVPPANSTPPSTAWSRSTNATAAGALRTPASP